MREITVYDVLQRITDTEGVRAMRMTNIKMKQLSDKLDAGDPATGEDAEKVTPLLVLVNEYAKCYFSWTKYPSRRSEKEMDEAMKSVAKEARLLLHQKHEPIQPPRRI